MEPAIDRIYRGSPNAKQCVWGPLQPLHTGQCPDLQGFFVDVPAGFPSPAADYEETSLDLNKYLVRNPAATFFVRAAGDSMTGAGIYCGDILVVDRSIEPRDKSIVIAVVNGQFTVKRIRISNRKITLEPENENYCVQEIGEGMEFEVWGVVTAVLHRL